MPRILLLDRLDDIAERTLAAAADVRRPASRDEESMLTAVADCDGIIAKTSTPITRRLLTASSRLRVVGIAGVGLDRLDVAAAEELGIRVIHTPGAASDAVAELTIALMLQLLRPTARLADQYRRGGFAEARTAPHGFELRERTIGILGLGRIGSRVARICSAGFGSRVIYHDIVEVGHLDFNASRVTFDELLALSDILSLHVPLTPATRGLFSAPGLKKMRPTAYLINTCRGPVVDTAALLSALADCKLAGAGLDVTDPEPLDADHPLLALPNCIVTPHIAARTYGGFRRMNGVVDEVLAVLHESPTEAR